MQYQAAFIVRRSRWALTTIGQQNNVTLGRKKRNRLERRRRRGPRYGQRPRGFRNRNRGDSWKLTAAGESTECDISPGRDTRHPFSKAYSTCSILRQSSNHHNHVCGSWKSQASSLGQTAQSLACSIIEKPHTRFDECLRMLQARSPDIRTFWMLSQVMIVQLVRSTFIR